MCVLYWLQRSSRALIFNKPPVGRVLITALTSISSWMVQTCWPDPFHGEGQGVAFIPITSPWAEALARVYSCDPSSCPERNALL